ncbi:AraC family transcriptional regulator [Aquimarina sp. BL5]|uniref:helix-turn-helix domain-containing protein n=2 Tax=Aquimarina sp. BL5 TaxID=1714860 RepID=UPI000E5089E1|nr:AraC family transcriptional regulator [Aquimarina sp. BL5]AXT51792.1 AraC family transcriptional regulator [Aquimarina sp. BL5]RKN11813.1 helix-turn-helix domain-containing protein [Aquimarina sp. BL5]
MLKIVSLFRYMKPSSHIKAYDKLSDLYNDENVGKSILQDSDFTIHRMEKVHPRPTESPVFRANYFSFILVKKGKSIYTIDDHKFYTKPNTLYFTNPGHLKSFAIEEIVHGFIITSSEEYLKEHIHADVFDELSFLLTEMVPPCFLDQDRFHELLHLSEQILNEQSKKSILRHKIISSLFMVFLLKVKEFLLQDDSFKIAYDRDSEIVNQFKKDLESVFRSKNLKNTDLQVAAFADNQQLHPAYFSTVIKTKTGQSANKWIQDKTIIEAQALLSKSNTPIKEIAYRLGFNEPTHFSKFFKKQTNFTPNQYRNK